MMTCLCVVHAGQALKGDLKLAEEKAVRARKELLERTASKAAKENLDDPHVSVICVVTCKLLLHVAR